MVGLDICGIDVMCETVLKPLEEQGGAILEVNAAPGLRMHLSPSYGKGRQVGEAIIDMMFPSGEDGRIPVVAVTGTNGKTTTVRMTAHLLESTGLRVGMTTTDGVYVSGDRIDTGDCSGPRSARNVLAHPDVDAAVFETARGGILREGLGFDRCQVAVVTNIGQGDHLGLGYITSVEDLSVLKWVVVQSLPPDGTAVLNAADPIVARMGASCSAEVIYFAQSALNPVISVHRAQGRRAIFVEDGDMVGARGKTVLWRVPLAAIPLTAGGAFGFQVDNAMAAAGAAWACGLDADQLAAGLATFTSDAQTAPGRFNQFSYRGATLIADYGHNPDAMRALSQAIESMPAARRHVVISGAGDRRDEDIREQTRILGDTFDNVILYQDQCQRGRADGEVLALLREGLAGTRKAGSVCEIRGEFLAIDTALDALEAGDVCLILVDQVEESLEYIRTRVEASGAGVAAA
jgi:cyanophycin synthetase